MSTTAKGPTGREDRPKPARKVSKAAKVGWGVYQQIAAVLAALGLAALLGHFWDIGWRGTVAFLVGVWDASVRPTVEWAFHILITVPLGWFGLDFEIPLSVRDYISAGLILSLSYVRVVRIESRGVSLRKISLFEMAPTWLEVILFIVLWPITIIGIGVGLAIRVRKHRREVIAASDDAALYNWMFETTKSEFPKFQLDMDQTLEWALLHMEAERQEQRFAGLKAKARRAAFALVRIVSPLLYLALLLAVNFWVMPHIS